MTCILATLLALAAPAATTQKHISTADIVLWVIGAVMLVLLIARRRSRKAREGSARSASTSH